MARLRLVGKRISFIGMLGTSAEKRADLRAAGVEIAVKVQNRTQGGKDENNARFKPYTPAYAKQKGVGVTQVDLYRSGDMLNNLDVLEVTDHSVAVGFSDSAMKQRAEHNEARGRKFLGVPASWIEAIKRSHLLRRMAQGR